MPTRNIVRWLPKGLFRELTRSCLSSVNWSFYARETAMVWQAMPDDDWQGEVGAFSYEIIGYGDLEPKKQRHAMELADKTLRDVAQPIEQGDGKPFFVPSFGGRGALLISGDYRHPLRVLEQFVERITETNQRSAAEYRLALRYALHHGAFCHGAHRLGAALEHCQRIFEHSDARDGQVIASDAYRAKVLAFGSIPEGLFQPLASLVDGQGRSHRVFNVRQNPGFGIDPPEVREPLALNLAREHELRRRVEQLLPELWQAVATARRRKDSAFQLFDRFEGSMRLLATCLADPDARHLDRIARLNRWLESDMKRLRELDVGDCFEAVPIDPLFRGIAAWAGADGDRDAVEIPNDLLLEACLPHWQQRQNLLGELREVETALDVRAYLLTGERDLICMECAELRIILDRDPLPVADLIAARTRLERLRINLLDRLKSLTQLFLGIYADRLPPGAVFQDAEHAPELVILSAGRFVMGSPRDEKGRSDDGLGFDEDPQHEVRIGHRFAVGRYPVTFEEYDRFATETVRERPNDEGWGRGRRPVMAVSWDDARDYASWLSQETGQSYRLPSEAEWEYACRAGTTTRHSWGDDEPTTERANFDQKVGKTTEVGSYPANPWGLYDMHGNVGEWVEDVWHSSYKGAPSDGRAWTTGDDSLFRMVRGGSWLSLPRDLRSAARDYSSGTYDRVSTWGFRVARTLSRSESLPLDPSPPYPLRFLAAWRDRLAGYLAGRRLSLHAEKTFVEATRSPARYLGFELPLTDRLGPTANTRRVISWPAAAPGSAIQGTSARPIEVGTRRA